MLPDMDEDDELGEREAPSPDYFRELVAKAILFIELATLIRRKDSEVTSGSPLPIRSAYQA